MLVSDKFSCIDTFTKIYIITFVDSLDWKDYGVDSIIRTVTCHENLGCGSIILCHNGAKYTADALEEMIICLKEQGYSFVKMSDLIYKENYRMDVTGRQCLCEE